MNFNNGSDDLFGLALGHRQKPPILGPCLVVDIKSQPNFLGEAGGIERALTLASAKEERGRVYRIADPANL